MDALVNGLAPSLTARRRQAALERPAPNAILRFP
jgi:hypothetical protein